MPNWAGKWKGGRFYIDELGRKVFFIERRRRTVKVQSHDEELAVGELARFLKDPVAFCRPPEKEKQVVPVFITTERLTLYMESIRKTVVDHQKARKSYLLKWADLGFDLRTVDRKALRLALADFDGGHRGRTEALNAFCRFLVAEGDLEKWNPLVNTRDPEHTRAERMAYPLDRLHTEYSRIKDQRMKDLFLLRVATGMHHTEIAQLERCKLYEDMPLPDHGMAIRILGGDHEIQGVLQVMHKSRKKHRVSVNAAVLRAALRLRENGVPNRMAFWKQLTITPSNLRHTFTTLGGEIGVLVTYTGKGIPRSAMAQALGHRAGSTMTADRYDKVQIPPMVKLPLENWDVL